MIKNNGHLSGQKICAIVGAIEGLSSRHIVLLERGEIMIEREKLLERATAGVNIRLRDRRWTVSSIGRASDS
jgi:hypothetical protein